MVDPMHEVEFIDLPPADNIAFHLERAGNPSLTYGEYVRRWQANTRRLRDERRDRRDAGQKES